MIEIISKTEKAVQAVLTVALSAAFIKIKSMRTVDNDMELGDDFPHVFMTCAK